MCVARCPQSAACLWGCSASPGVRSAVLRKSGCAFRGAMNALGSAYGCAGQWRCVRVLVECRAVAGAVRWR